MTSAQQPEGYLKSESGGRAIVDLTGQRFGRLVVMHMTQKRYGGSVVWHCVCDCGREVDAPARFLRNGRTKSCGCLRAKNRQGKTPGIIFVKSRNKYNVYVRRNGRQYHIGTAAEMDQAIMMRDAAENVPDENFDKWISDLKQSRKKGKTNEQ